MKPPPVLSALLPLVLNIVNKPTPWVVLTTLVNEVVEATLPLSPVAFGLTPKLSIVSSALCTFVSADESILLKLVVTVLIKDAVFVPYCVTPVLNVDLAIVTCTIELDDCENIIYPSCTNYNSKSSFDAAATCDLAIAVLALERLLY